MPKKFRIAEAAKYLGVSTKTLRRWEASGRLLPKRSHGFHRFYTQELLDNFSNKNKKHQIITNHIDLTELQSSILIPHGLPNFKEAIPMPVSKVSVFKTISFTILGSLVLAGIIFGSVFAYTAKHNQKSPTGLTLAGSAKGQPAVLAAATSADTYTFKVTIPSLFTEGAVFDKDISAPNLKMFNSVKVGTSTINATNDAGVLEMTGSGLTVATDTTGTKLVFTVPSTDLTATGWTKSGSNIYLTTSTNKVGIGTTSPSAALDVSGGFTVSSGTVTFPSGAIANAALANPSITITAGTGMTGGGSVALGGSVTMSLPQGVDTTSTPSFSGLTVNGPEIIAPTASGTALTIRASSTSPVNILELTDSTGTTSYLSVSPTGSLTINGSTLTNTGLLESSGAIHLTNSSNTIVGTAIEGGWTLNSLAYTYRRQMTVTNNDATTALPVNHEITVSLSGSTASQIFNTVRSDKNDFRVSSGSAEIARNITTFTASSIIFSFQLQTAIATSSSDTNYYIYYRNTTLASPIAPTYTGNVQLDSADTVASWTSSDAGYVLSQETTIKQEGTGSVKIAATTGNFPTVTTASQAQLSAGVSKQSTPIITASGTSYIYSIGGENAGVAQTGVYKSTIDGSGNTGTFSTTSQGQLPTALTRSGNISINKPVSLDTGTGSDGTFDLSLGGGAGGCSGTNLTWTAGTNTCTFTVNVTKNTWNFTSINVPAGTTVTTNGPFYSASTNFFLTMKATGMATISGTINLSGKGYGAVVGPGAGKYDFFADNGWDCITNVYGGAGYGGVGGGSFSGGGPTYNTIEPGSGGGGGGGAGGGGIAITSSGNMTVNSILANGTDGSDGGGSGGRITLSSSGTISFSGAVKTIQANGGNGGLGNCGGGGGGGGGRITIQDSTTSMGGTGTITLGGTMGGGAGVISYLSSISTYYLYTLGGLNGTAQTLVYKSAVDGSFNAGAFSTASQGQLPQALFNLSSLTANVGGTDYLYALGGNNGTSDQTTVYKSTVDSSGNIGAWSTSGQGQLPQGISEHTSILTSVGGTNYIYVIGGKNGSTAQTTVYKAAIDGSGNIGTFSTVSQGQLPVGVYGHGSFTATVNNTQYLYVLGGKNTAGTTQSTVYRAALDGSGNVGAWTTTSQNALPQTLYGLSSFANGTNVYVLGGHNGTSDQTTVYKGSLVDWSNYQVTKTISSTNLTNKNGFQYKVYSSITGSPARFRFSEDGITWQTCTFSVSSANTWETKTCDITGISSANRDGVTKIQFDSSAATVTPFTFYFDDINSLTSLFGGTAPGSTSAAAIMGASDLLLNAQGSGAIKFNYDATNALAGTGGVIIYNGASTPLLTITGSGMVNATAGGIATYSKAGVISDADFTNPVNGLVAVDSTDSRIYIRTGGAWHYIAFTAGFQIPAEEAAGMNDGDFLMPYVEKHLSDGALHGLYTKFSDINTGGYALIKTGTKEVRINFDKPFTQVPVVTASAIWDIDSNTLASMKELTNYFLPEQSYIVADVTAEGFSIVLYSPASTDLKFSWNALLVRGAKTITNEPPAN